MTSHTGKRNRRKRACKHWKTFGENIINGATMLSQDFKEFIELLNSNDVRYLVIGGYALAAHGHPRYTKDIDIWVESTEENANKLVQVLSDFGFASLGLSKSDFVEADKMVQLGYPPDRIDLLTSADGVEFSDCYRSRCVIDFDGVPISFIDLQHLKMNKRATARPRDLADLEELE